MYGYSKFDMLHFVFLFRARVTLLFLLIAALMLLILFSLAKVFKIRLQFMENLRKKDLLLADPFHSSNPPNQLDWDAEREAAERGPDQTEIDIGLIKVRRYSNISITLSGNCE